MKYKICSRCREKKEVTEFYERVDQPGNYKSWCKKCHNQDTNDRNKRNREDALICYSGNPPKCQCCGESHNEFLAIDHINGGGGKFRKASRETVFNFLKRNGYPEGYRVLCHNCNLAIGFYGKCPHTK